MAGRGTIIMQGRQDMVGCSCTLHMLIACSLTHLSSFDGLKHTGDVHAESCLLPQPLLLLRLSLCYLLPPGPVTMTPHAITDNTRRSQS